ncbi:MAG: hypothetical protein ACTSUQ_02095 [Candidatus Freyarchaeota archaeon]
MSMNSELEGWINIGKSLEDILRPHTTPERWYLKGREHYAILGVVMTVFEIVIPDCADRYASFLEFFGRQLKYSDLKRVMRIGVDHWDLSGGIFSKGMVQIR